MSDDACIYCRAERLQTISAIYRCGTQRIGGTYRQSARCRDQNGIIEYNRHKGVDEMLDED